MNAKVKADARKLGNRSKIFSSTVAWSYLVGSLLLELFSPALTTKPTEQSSDWNSSNTSNVFLSLSTETSGDVGALGTTSEASSKTGGKA